MNKEKIEKIIWKSCESFRGITDSSNYKDYVLSMLFMKYISDLYNYELNNIRKKYPNDEDAFQYNKNRMEYILDDNCTFQYLINSKSSKEIGKIINDAISRIEELNSEKLKGTLSFVDFNNETYLGDTVQKNRTLKSLITTFEDKELDFTDDIKDTSVDILGDVYEYLISKFASTAGKKGGEFYTPGQVSTILAKILKPSEGSKIYDPTCGSGSLLIKAAKEVGSTNFSVSGQELNNQTEVLARMNMLLHRIDDATIRKGNTLTNPQFTKDGKLEKFDIVVANPPFSQNISDDMETLSDDQWGRFIYGLPPKNKGDYAFVQHMVASLNDKGRMATVLPEGPMFRGASEGKIREELIKTGIVEGVIRLPSNLFFGTGISAVILVINKGIRNNSIFMINASNEFESSKNQNVLSESNVKKIVDTWLNKVEIEEFSKKVSFDDIKDNDYSLNVNYYVDNSEKEKEYDINELEQEIKTLNKEINESDEKLFSLLKKEGIWK